MTQMEKSAIDRYVTEHLPGGLTPREQAVQAFQNRANKLEADVNPLFTIAKRREELLKNESVYNDNAEKNIAAGYFLINAYADKPFKLSVQRSVRQLCCAIKTDHDWIVHIQERVAKGLPPLENDSNQAPPDIVRRQIARPVSPNGGFGDGQPRFRLTPEQRRERRRQRIENRRKLLQKQQEEQGPASPPIPATTPAPAPEAPPAPETPPAPAETQQK